MNGPQVKISDLSVGYAGRALISGIEIEIARGEVVALIGPNGAGKSTILKSIARQLAPLNGTVFIDGEDLRRVAPRTFAKKLAAVLTERARPELVTCGEVVESGRYPHTGMLGILSADDRREVELAMNQTGTLDLADREFSAISDGQRQRVLLARALCQRADVVVLDEPTSFLDIKHKIELLSLLRTMAKDRGISVIMSLHEIDLAERSADRLICVKGDHPFKIGTPEEVFSENIIRELYDIDQGTGWDVLFGSVEMPRLDGDPEVFVIAGGGSGVPIFRSLQRRGVPFAAGVLHENDVDYRVASALASKVVVERAFEPISDEKINEAKEIISKCRSVIAAEVQIGAMNSKIRELVDEAKSKGLLEQNI